MRAQKDELEFQMYAHEATSQYDSVRIATQFFLRELDRSEFQINSKIASQIR